MTEGWVPGTYYFRSELPGSGTVIGRIDVGAEGPDSATSNVGPCLMPIENVVNRPNPSALQLERRDRGAFVCGTEHRLSVWLGYEGGPPIRGTVSNQRTVTETTYAETTCREYQTTETGERICMAWNVGPKTERRTTGATANFYLVPDSLALRPQR
jgi:hypothetical protein